MQTPGFGRYTLSSCVAAAMLAGCGGSQPPIGAPDAMTQSRAIGAHSDHSGSWMMPGATRIKKLLYISDIETNDVFVYNYATAAQVRQLTGFNFPQGQCVDKIGDVWIANFANGGSGVSVVEYAHGGTSPIATVIPESNPIGCSIDPRTGDLAVAMRSDAYGEIEIWASPSSTPTTYVNPRCGALWSPGYDDKGNLFTVGGINGSPPAKVCELPARGTALEPVRVLNKAIYDSTGIMWDGKYITLSDSESFSRPAGTVVYQAVAAKATAGNATTLTIVGTTALADYCHFGSYIQQPFVVGKKNTPENNEQGTVVIGGNLDCYTVFDFWNYPNGGTSSRHLKSSPLRPQGQSVSIAPD
jgi:hypothetical protein